MTDNDPLVGDPAASGGAGWVPRQTTDLCGVKVLVLAAHPDDESLACGGAIALHRRQEDPVKVVVISDGACWIWGEGPAPADYADCRRREVEKACEVLGVIDLELWGLVDGGLTDSSDLADRIAKLLTTYRPELVYSPSPEDSHEDHRAVARALWRARLLTGVKLRIAYHDFSLPLAVNTLVDISDVVEVKRQACDCHRSQLEHLPYTEIALALNRYRSLTVAMSCDWAEGYLVVDPSVFSPGPRQRSEDHGRPVPESAPVDDAPLISVIVRTRNRPLLLGQALASVAAQTWRPLEVVVVNDGGSEISSVLAEYGQGLDLRLVENPESVGRSAAGNQGVAVAAGRYVAFLDDDDLLHPGHLERLVADLHSAGSAVVYSDCEIGAFELIGGRVVTVAEPEPFPVRDFDADWLHLRNFIPLNSAVFTRELWQRVGGFDESLEALEDWDLWLRMSQEMPFRRVPGISASIRVFADHHHDFISAMAQVYAKHHGYWTPTNLAERIWPRVQQLEAAASSVEGPVTSAEGTLMRLLLRVIPYRLKHWLNLRLQAYRRW